jgi:hypothetical protein
MRTECFDHCNDEEVGAGRDEHGAGDSPSDSGLPTNAVWRLALGRKRPMLERNAKARVHEVLNEFRIVYIAGPRQSGKTTLAKAPFCWPVPLIYLVPRKFKNPCQAIWLVLNCIRFHSSNVSERDFVGLASFAEFTGPRLKRGVIFYAGERVLPFRLGNHQFHAVPLSWLS